MNMTKITLLSRDLKHTVAEPEILWPPLDGAPDVLFVDGRTFVFTHTTVGGSPVYHEARVLGITGIDLRRQS